MRGLQIATLLCGSSVAVLLVTEEPAAGRSKRRNQHAHSHGHSHSHDTEEDDDSHGHSHARKHNHGHSHAHSPLTIGAGVTVAKSFGNGSAEGAESGGDEHAGHSHALTDSGLHLDEGHSHAGGPEGSSETEESSGIEPAFALTAGYRLSSRFGLNLGIGFGVDSGIGDPSFGVTYGTPLQKNLALSATVAATAPLSEASKDNYKTTSVTFGVGPTWTLGRITAGGRASVSKSYYSKTIIVEEETVPARIALPLQETDVETDHGHGVEDAGTGDREFDRYGLTGTFGYKLAKRWSISSGLGVSFVKMQFGDSTIETNATVAQGTFSWNAISASLGLITSGADTKFTAPTTPGITAGVFYTYE